VIFPTSFRTERIALLPFVIRSLDLPLVLKRILCPHWFDGPTTGKLRGVPEGMF
jgi:hypothetical protein